MKINKAGAKHKLAIQSAEDGHAGRYAFQVDDIKTEASLFVGGKKKNLQVTATSLIVKLTEKFCLVKHYTVTKRNQIQII